MTNKDVEQVAELLEQRLSYFEIKERTGFSTTRISRLIRFGRGAGLIPPRKPSTSRAKMSATLGALNIKRGSIQEIMEALPPEVRTWLLGNVPEGATIADFAASVIVDAYYEEVGDLT